MTIYIYQFTAKLNIFDTKWQLKIHISLPERLNEENHVTVVFIFIICFDLQLSVCGAALARAQQI